MSSMLLRLYSSNCLLSFEIATVSQNLPFSSYENSFDTLNSGPNFKKDKGNYKMNNSFSK